MTGLALINTAAIVNAGLAVRRVAAAGGYTYIGDSLGDDPGDDEAVWLIRRVDADGNTAFADGAREFTKVWDDRAGYTYAI